MKQVLKGIWAIPVIASILILGVLASAPGVAAVPITFEFTVEITQVQTFGSPSVLTSFFSVGDQISGTFTFDSLATDTSAGSTIGTYVIDDFNVSHHLAGPSSSGSISIFNNAGGTDELLIILQFQDPSFSIVLDDFSATVFDSDLLLLVPPDVSAFQSRSFNMIFFNTGGPDFVEIFGTVTSLTLATPDVTQAQLDAALAALAIAEAERDAALDDLIDLFTNNSCDPLAETIPEVFVCITDLIADLAAALVTITGLETEVEELEAEVEELGQPGPPVANQGNGQGVPAQGKNKP